MKLNVVRPGTGALWVRAGIRTFLSQPLALSGQFFLLMAAASLLGLVPYIGSALSLMLFPVATVGLMAATREALDGKFPMPAVLLSGFRAGPTQTRAMLLLGALYMVGIVLVFGATALVDGGKFARLYLVGGAMTQEVLQDPDFQIASLLMLALYLPLSMAFWHAPALVHWHQVPVVKSLFFSLVACVRNLGAFAVFSLLWGAVFFGAMTLVVLIGALAGSAELSAALIFPTAMLLAAMFFTSLYFTYRDCFLDHPTEPTP